MRKNFIKKMLLCPFLFLFLLILQGKGSFSLANEFQPVESITVKVGFPLQDGIAEKDEENNFSGYTYDYLSNVKKFTGWNFEFITLEGTLDEQIITLMDMLEKGEIDLMGCMHKSEYMEEMYQFSEMSSGLAS